MASKRFYVNSALDTSLTFHNSQARKLDRVVVVGLQLRNSVALAKAVEKLGINVIYSDTGLELNNESGITFVLEHFDGTSFKALKKSRRHGIISSELLIYSANKKQEIPYRMKPLYCLSMIGINMAFDMVKSNDREEVDRQSHWSTLASYMGAILKSDVTSKITHLVSSNSTCDQYRRAVSLDIPVMTWEWIYYSWERRNDFGFCATSENVLNQFSWRPFKGLKLMFFNFPKEEKTNMSSLTIENQGLVLSSASGCTHFVVNEKNPESWDRVDLPEKAFVVTSKWFWSSILIVARAQETMFPYPPKDDDTFAEKKFQQRPEPNLSRTESEKQKFVKDDLNQLVKEVDPEFVDLSSSALDDPTSPSRSNQLQQEGDGQQQVQERGAGPRSKREYRIYELYKTECNYVAVLTTIVKQIKRGAESETQRGGAILNPQESKELFEGIIPIMNLHLKIKAELEKIVNNWDTPRTVGDIYLKQSAQFLQCYPQFINFFEATQKAIKTYRDKKPRFRAFLCICQNFPQCGRQTLEELMIKPVQRLPSTLLLLKDIEQLTPEGHSDSGPLRAAMTALEEALRKINESKRQMESYQLLLDTVTTIEYAPSTLVSGSRSLVCQLDCLEVTNQLRMKGHDLRLFVFSDCLVIAKKRFSKSSKPYKYLETEEFRSIKRIIKVLDKEGKTECVGIVIMNAKGEIILKAFILKDGDSSEKDNFINIFSATVCNFVCNAKPDEFVATRKNYELGLDPSKAVRRGAISRLMRKSGFIGRSSSQNEGTFRTPAPPRDDGQADMRASTFSLASSCSSKSTVAESTLNESELFFEDLDETVVHTPTNPRRRETFAAHTEIRRERETQERVNDFLSNLGQFTPQSNRSFLGRIHRSSSRTSSSSRTNLKHSDSSASSGKGK